MIVFKNSDVPGVIADISTILAKSGVNIADFRLGRDEHGLAMAVILVDEDISKKLISELNSLETCIWAEYAVL
jgi:D-3-phosphoglycerate dehydrogenase